VNETAEAEGVTNSVTHLVYSHHHASHIGAAYLFGDDVIRVGHAEARQALSREADPHRPAPTLTFAGTRHTLRVGGERVELAHHGPNHSRDNIFIHFPDHDALMLVDVVNAGWIPLTNPADAENLPGYLAAPDGALAYDWRHFIGGHLGRLGNRDDVVLHQEYMKDVIESCHTTLMDSAPRRQAHRPDADAYLEAVAQAAAAPVVAKYTGVLGGADVAAFTVGTALTILWSIWPGPGGA
jgi:glyoxylase-like metal-dependent hydrolase (beta-lactamase superfamily II)